MTDRQIIIVKATHLRYVYGATAKNDYQAIFRTVSFQPDRLVATDGFHAALTRNSYPADGPEAPLNILFRNTIPTYSKGIVKLDLDAQVAVWENGRAVAFDIIDKEFPDVDRVLPKDDAPLMLNDHVPLDILKAANVLRMIPDFTFSSEGKWVKYGDGSALFILDFEDYLYMLPALKGEHEFTDGVAL